MIYPISGEPKFFAFGLARADIRDWRPDFLRVGAPLVFITTFKLIDMLIEWVLMKNGVTTTFRFEQKLAALKPSVQFPDIVESRPWWRQRLIGLYASLEPLRGTLIHDRHFATNNGNLEVASSKRGVIGNPVQIDAAQLRVLARCIVSTLRYVDGSWAMDHHQERTLRYEFDLIAPLHRMPSLGQKRPHSPTVRVFSKNPDPRTVDTLAIARDLANTYPECDCRFDLRFLFIQNGCVARAYLIDWRSLESPGRLDTDRFVCDIPDDVDPEHCA